MTKHLKLPAPVIPESVLNQHVAVLGKTRSGKSSVMRGLVEGLLARELPVCIVDPKGDWWGIKLAADGKRAGFPVVIFGGEHADVPINEHAGAHVAELFATGNRPCLIDLGGWMVEPRTRFWIDFASTLFKHTKGDRWLVVDEVHNFCPKGKIYSPEAGKMLHWTNRLASEGLGKGVAMLVASQRPQKVHNDTLSSCETLVAMRVIHPSDREAIAEWIQEVGDGSGNEVLKTVAQMERGEGWVWSPENKFGPARVKFPMFATYDSFRPQTVEDTQKLKGWAEVNLDDVRAKLTKVVEEAKANDPKELKKQNAEKDKRIAALDRDLTAARAERPASKGEDVPVLTDADRARLEKLGELIDAAAALMHEDLALVVQRFRLDMEQTAATFVDLVAMRAGKAEQAIADELKKASVQRALGKLERVQTPAPAASRLLSNARPDGTLLLRRPPITTDGNRPASRPASDGTALAPGERKILTAVAQFGEVDRGQLTVLVGYKATARDTYISRLAQKGFVESGQGRVRVTQAGVDALGSDYEPLPTGPALLDFWRARLAPGECKVLDAAVEVYPQPISRADIGERTQYKPTARDTYISRLASRRLVKSDGRGSVIASAELFS